jgi:hypothetical protein
MSTRTAKENAEGLPQNPIRIGDRLYATASWTEAGVVYKQNTAAGTCTCPAGQHGRPCKHLANAQVAELFRCIGIARTCVTRALEIALGEFKKAGDTVSADACRWVLKERAEEEAGEARRDREAGCAGGRTPEPQPARNGAPTDEERHIYA